MIRLIKSDDVEQAVDLACYCFPNLLGDEKSLKNLICSIASEGWAFGHYNGDRLTAQIIVNPYTTIIDGTSLDMGGIGLVSSYPESRHGGTVSALIVKCIESQKERGFCISYLGPFSFPFYRKYGYEHAFDKKYITLKTSNLQYFKGAGHLVRGSGMDIPVMNKLYETYMLRYSGYILRTPRLLNQMATALEESKTVFIYLYYDENGETTGYIRYRFSGNVFTVLELVYLNIDALKGILNFIYVHDSQFKETCFSEMPMDFPLRSILPNHCIEEKVVHGMMARVIDVEKAVSLRKYTVSGHVSIKIIDQYAPWNDHSFQFNFLDNTCLVSNCDSEAEIVMSIQSFTQLYCGFVDLDTLLKLDKTKCSNIHAAELLSGAFRQQITHLADHF